MSASQLFNKLPISLLVVVLSLGLSACGYQLRGSNDSANLPSHISVYADDQKLATSTAKILTKAKVDVTIAKYSVSTDPSATNTSKPNSNIAGLRFINTKASREGVIYDANGDATHWRYTVSTEMLLGTGANSKSFKLQEYLQIELDTASGAGSTNDRIISNTWQELYQGVARQAVRILGNQL